MGGSPQVTSSTPTIDPQLKQAILSNISDANQITSGIMPKAGDPAQTSFVADFTPDQMAAFDKVRGIANNPLTASQLGGDIYSRLGNFQAGGAGTIQVGATPYEAQQISAPAMAASQVSDVGGMSAGQVAPVGGVASKNFTDYNLSGYAQPYMSQVIDPVKQYFDTQSDRAASAARGQASAAGAARGSNLAVADALAREGIASQAGMALSPLYQDAFKTSAGLVQADAGRDLTASQGNQATQLTRATTQAGLDTTAAGKSLDVAAARAQSNAQLAQQAGLANQDSALRALLANQGAGLQAGLANQDADLRGQLANQDNVLKAQLANQQGAVQSAGIQAAAAAGLAGANQGAQNSAITGAGLLNQTGNQQQDLATQRLLDQLKALQTRSGAVFGAIPGMTGSTTTQTGGGSGIAGALGGLGSLAGGLGALGLTI